MRGDVVNDEQETWAVHDEAQAEDVPSEYVDAADPSDDEDVPAPGAELGPDEAEPVDLFEDDTAEVATPPADWGTGEGDPDAEQGVEWTPGDDDGQVED